MGGLAVIGFIVMIVFTIRTLYRRSQKRPGSNWIWALSGLAAWVVGVAVVGSQAAASISQEVAREQAATEAPAEAAAPAQVASVSHNWEADIGGLEFRIQNVAKHNSVQTNDYDAETANGVFLVVQLTVANHSGKAATVSSSDFHLKRNGQEYDANSSMAMMSEGFEMTQINPGLAKTAEVAFDVPTGTALSEYQLEVYGNGTDGSQESTLISLAKTQ